MSSSAYWDSQYKSLMANKPKSASSYYNQSFVDKMNEAQRNIDNLVAVRDRSLSASNQKMDEYNAFYGSMRAYGDVYDKAESEFGVKETHETYEKSKQAIALAESAMDALPSSINAGSNRVLTQSQREARYEAEMNKWNKVQARNQQQSSMYEQAWKNARENQSAYAKAEMEAQYSKLGDFNIAWITAQKEYDNAVKAVLDAKAELNDWGEQYRQWQNRQYAQQWEIWNAQLSNALDRYSAALRAESTMRNADASKYLGNTNKNMSFIDYINSDANWNSYGSDVSSSERRRWNSQLINNYQTALRTGNKNALDNIYAGEVYRSYLAYTGRR